MHEKWIVVSCLDIDLLYLVKVSNTSYGWSDHRSEATAFGLNEAIILMSGMTYMYAVAV